MHALACTSLAGPFVSLFRLKNADPRRDTDRAYSIERIINEYRSPSEQESVRN